MGKVDLDPTDDPLVTELQQYIADRAPVWEASFEAGPGNVVSLSDAAHVVAEWLLERKKEPEVVLYLVTRSSHNVLECEVCRKMAEKSARISNSIGFPWNQTGVVNHSVRTDKVEGL